MELKIVELAHQRGLTMSDIAKQIGISRVNLSNSLNGNPTLSRLKEVAAILKVEVYELFKTPEASEINGYVEYNGRIIKINSKESLTALINQINAEQK